MDSNELLRLIRAAKDGFEHYKDIFLRVQNDFLGKLDTTTKQKLQKREKSALFIPITASKVRRILASFQEAYFTNDSIVHIHQSLEGSAPAETISELQRAFDYYMKNKTKPFFTLTRNMLGAILHGTPIAKVYWSGDKPIIENVSVFDCWLDPQAEDARDIKYLVHNLKMARSDILALKKQGIFGEELGFEPDEQPYKREKLQEVYYLQETTWNVATFIGQNKVRDVALADGLPFVVGALLPQVFDDDEDAVRAYGDSPTSILLPLQREINIRRNQQIDAIALYLNPRILVESGSLIDPNQIIKGAGQIIQCERLEGAKFMPMPPIQESIFDVNRLDTEAQEALGVTSYNSGVDNNNTLLNSTATGVSILSSEANTRINALIRAYNETFVEPLMTRIAMLIYKYDPLFMGNFALRAPIEILASINTGIGATNPQTQISNLDKAFAMFLQTQNLQGANAVIDEMLPLLGIKNKEKFLQQQAQMAQQQMQAQNAQEQMAQAPP